MADTLFALRNAGVPQDVIAKLTGNKEAMEIFKRCDALMKADDQLKADDSTVPKPRQVVTSGGLKWQKADGKWIGGGNDKKHAGEKDDDKSLEDKHSQQKEQNDDKAHEAVKQETTAETAACSSSPSPTLDNTPDVHEFVPKKHNRSGIPWYATIALVVGAILATFLLTSQTLKAECRSMECPVVPMEVEKVDLAPTSDCDCPEPERVTCPASKVPQQVLDNVRKLQAELVELQAKRSLGEDCPQCSCDTA